jgi:hypothetical protein
MIPEAVVEDKTKEAAARSDHHGINGDLRTDGGFHLPATQFRLGSARKEVHKNP